MAYMGFVNLTKFKAGQYLLADEKNSDVLLFVVKATYNIVDNNTIALAEEQSEICEAPEYYGEPEKTSIKYESEIYYTKKHADAVLIGHAQVPGQLSKKLDVVFCAGDVKKHVRVFGDRFWKKSFGFWKPSKPELFNKKALKYDYAFGGRDNSHKNEKYHDYEARNPVGIGFMAKKNSLKIKGHKIPNIENPDNLIKNPSDKPAPVGFGFICPDWEPKKKYAGTYDHKWEKEKMPLLPGDFDQKFYNAGSSDLISDNWFSGGEQVDVINASSFGNLRFNLPSATPETVVKMKDGTRHQLEMFCDTLIVNTDENKVFILWRNHMNVYKKVHKILWTKTWIKKGEV